MSRDARQQQRKEKRNKRAKEKQKKLNQSKSVSPFAQLAKFDAAPFLHCCINGVAFTQGIGNLLVSRAIGNRVVVVIFLVDLYCLGIKNITYKLCSRIELERIVRDQLFHREPALDLTPEEAKKLVVEAAAYAARYGFRPHEDYLKTLAIFAGVDASSCPREFTFGNDGKPFYISGPHDGAAFRNRVRETLERSAGAGNFNFVTVLDEREFDDHLIDGAFDEIDDDDDDLPLELAENR